MTTLTPSPLTLLVADHDPDELRLIQQGLEGHHVHIASDGPNALRLLESQKPDLILMRVDLPEMSGLEICRQVKQNESLSFAHILLLATPEAMDSSFEAGADDVLARPINAKELQLRLRGFLRARKRYQELFEQNAQMVDELAKRNFEADKYKKEQEQIQQLKDSIVHTVAHELRTPLLQIKSAVAMLADDARTASPNGASTLADHATAATAKLESVVQNITQLASAMNVKLEPFRLPDAVQIAIRALSRQWAKSGEVNRIVIPTNEVPPVFGDRSGVAQVLQKLVENGIKFSPEGGQVEILAEKRDESVWIAVRDHGIGIPENQRDRIFQAFYQVDSSSTRRYSGTGVGLAIVKLLLDAMGSTIHVESAPDKGSTFSFMLPCAREEPAALTSTQAATLDKAMEILARQSSSAAKGAS